jgi:transcriptional regulator with XRE-family HTH domain
MPRHIERRRSRAGRPRKWIEIPLANWMKASGIRAEDLADELEVDHSTVYRWLRGEQLPTLETAKAIANIARRKPTEVGPLTLEMILKKHDAGGHKTRRGESDGVLSRPTSEARDRRLATAQE